MYLGLEILLSYFLYLLLKFEVNGLIIIIHVSTSCQDNPLCTWLFQPIFIGTVQNLDSGLDWTVDWTVDWILDSAVRDNYIEWWAVMAR